ncbi:MAG: hypothetical protein ACREM1_11820 [Longimicrobiales bacterium]
MGIRAKVALCASLALVLPQFTRLEWTRGPEDRVDQVGARLHLHSEPHPEAEGARVRLPDNDLDRIEAKPFGQAAAADRSPSSVDLRARPFGSSDAGRSELVVLPFSRAGPTPS